MGTAQVELMAPATTFVKAQSFKERHLCKAQSESTDIAEIVESLSKFTFTVPVQAVQEEKEEEREYMAKCECCGLLEECTPAYVSRVKAIFCNRLVCGLCAEAVKEERFRMGPKTGMEDALAAHMKICYKFNTFTRQDPAADLAMAMRQILRRSIELGATPKPKGIPLPRRLDLWIELSVWKYYEIEETDPPFTVNGCIDRQQNGQS